MIPDEKMREIAFSIARRLLCDEIASALSAARREGIEEAANLARDLWDDGFPSAETAERIRALKDKQP